MSKTSIEWSPGAPLNRYRISGATMGDRYDVQFYAPAYTDVQTLAAELDAAVSAVDAQLSNWKTDSDLSQLNRAKPCCWVPVSAHLTEVLARALDIGGETGNAFNIGVGELVGAWGFGPMASQPPASGNGCEAAPLPPIGDLLDVDVRRCRARRRANVTFDLCGIAKGFGVDELARVLDRRRIGSWLIGLNGEMRARGGKADGSAWMIAVEAPDDERRAARSVIELCNAAVATSGDYRHWLEVGDMRISHTMEPRTGAPLCSEIASVTVMTATCMDADAYATALMVLGIRAGADFARQRGLDALFIVREGHQLREIGTGCFMDVSQPG